MRYYAHNGIVSIVENSLPGVFFIVKEISTIDSCSSVTNSELLISIVLSLGYGFPRLDISQLATHVINIRLEAEVLEG